MFFEKNGCMLPKSHPLSERNTMDNIHPFNLYHSSKFTNFLECLKEIEDPRAQHKVKHSLLNILIISIFSTLGGANDFVAIEQFGILHIEWFRSILDLKHGIPSHDTFLRVFTFIEPHQLDFWLLLWKEEYYPNNFLQHISFDGKEDNANGYYCVRAWDPISKKVLARQNVPSNSNEIPVVQSILKKINVKNTVVTGDAMNAQRKNARLIINGGGDYIFVLKKNQHGLYDDSKLFIDDIIKTETPGLDYDLFTMREKGHGRVEKRTCISTSNINWLDQKNKWKGLKTIGCIQSTRTLKNRTEYHNRYFISSLKDDSETILGFMRNQWSIENHSHRNLDTRFDSDLSTVKDTYAATNIAIIKDLALFVIEKHRGTASIRSLRSEMAFRFDTLVKTIATTPF